MFSTNNLNTRKMATKKIQSDSNKPKKAKGTALKVAGGILAGAAAGAIAGILLAPDSGKNTRKKIADNAKKAAKDAKGKVSSKVKEVASKVKQKTAKAVNKKA